MLARPALQNNVTVGFNNPIFGAHATASAGAGNVGLSTNSGVQLGSVFQSGQSHYTVVGASGLHTGSETQSSLGTNGSIINDNVIKSVDISGSGIATSSHVTHQVFGTGITSETKSSLGAGGISESGHTDLSLCGKDLCGCGCGCTNGCFKCDLDLCGSDCNFDCCSAIGKCCSGAFNLLKGCLSCVTSINCGELLNGVGGCLGALASCDNN